MSHVESRGPQVAGVAGGFLAASWICMLLRIYTRILIVKAFGADDYLAVVSQLFYTAFCSFAFLGVHYGTGRHAVDIPPADLIQGLKWWWMCEPMYVLGNMFLKISIGIFLLRLAVVRWQRITLYATMVGSTILGIWFFFMFVFQCYPSQYFWTQYIGGKGSCLNTNILVRSNYAFCSLECLADWIYFILPCLMVWRLQMNVKTKVSVILLLGLCGIASIATIVRFPYLSGFNNKADFLWATTDVAIWAIAENGLGSCATSIATLRPLFRHYLSTSLDSTDSYPLASTAKSAGYLSHDSSHKPPQQSMKWKDSADTELGLVPNSSMKVTTTIESGMLSRDTESGEENVDEPGVNDGEQRKTGRGRKDSQSKLIGHRDMQDGVWTTTTVVSNEDSA